MRFVFFMDNDAAHQIDIDIRGHAHIGPLYGEGGVRYPKVTVKK